MALSYTSAPFGRSGSGKRTADLTRSLAGNQFAREGLGRQRTMGVSDMTRRFADMRSRIPGQFNQRGMLDSGLRNQAWRKSFADQLRDMNRLRLGFDADLNQLNLGDFTAEGQYASGGLNQVLSDAQRRAAMAAQIRSAAL